MQDCVSRNYYLKNCILSTSKNQLKQDVLYLFRYVTKGALRAYNYLKNFKKWGDAFSSDRYNFDIILSEAPPSQKTTKHKLSTMN